MHNAAFAACGLNGVYQARQVRPAELGAALQTLRLPGVLGANLTIPHKEAALPLLDTLSAAAQRIGAVNTVVRRGGLLRGENTDAPGLLQALADVGYGAGGEYPAAVVLGAGGAARAAVYALGAGLGRHVYLVNRTRARAQELAGAWADSDVRVVAADIAEVPWREVGLIVNASSAGLGEPDQTPLPGLDFGCLNADTLIYDMVYAPPITRLMLQACAAGLRAENGLGMLAHQARLAFIAWTGCQPQASVFFEALERAGAAFSESASPESGSGGP